MSSTALWIDQPEVLFNPQQLKYYMPGPNMTWQEQANALVRLMIYLSLILFLFKGNPLNLIIPTLLMMGVQYYLHRTNTLKSTLTQILSPLSQSINHPIDPNTPQPEDQVLESFTNSKDDQLNLNNFLHLQDKSRPGHLDQPTPLNTISPRPDLGNLPAEPELQAKEIECKPPTSNNPFGNALPYDTIERQTNRSCPNEFAKDEKFYNKLFNNIDDLFDRNNSQRQFTTNPASTRINDREAALQFFYNTPYTEH